jgi:3-methylcrotonyl-CoA carboxylase alpha subunit
MPAIVVLVPVAEGDWVEKGQVVMVISAMKMETSLKAPYGGRITRIKVNEGDKVMPGDILVDIEATTQLEGGT